MHVLHALPLDLKTNEFVLSFGSRTSPQICAYGKCFCTIEASSESTARPVKHAQKHTNTMAPLAMASKFEWNLVLLENRLIIYSLETGNDEDVVDNDVVFLEISTHIAMCRQCWRPSL